MKALFSNRLVQGIALVLIVVAALVIRKVAVPTYAENLQFLTGGEAQVQFDSEVLSMNIAYNALRAGTPAVVIDVENAKKLIANFAEQAKLLDEEKRLLLAADSESDTRDIDRAMADLRARYQTFIDEQVKYYEYRQEILDLYKVVAALPKYNKAQNQALKACEAALEKGEWAKAKTECENAQSLAVPPTPVPSPTPTWTPTPATTPIALTPVVLTPLP